LVARDPFPRGRPWSLPASRAAWQQEADSPCLQKPTFICQARSLVRGEHHQSPAMTENKNQALRYFPIVVFMYITND
jgi:hypothetical protein